MLVFEVKSLKYQKLNAFTITVEIFSQIESQRESVDNRNNTAFEKDLRHARNDTEMNREEQGVEQCKEIRNCRIASSPTKRQDQLQHGWEIREKSYGRNQAVVVELSCTFILPPVSLSSQRD